MTSNVRSGPKQFSLLLALVVLTAAPTVVHAQDDHRVSIGAAAGVADPWHGDFDFTAGSWQADLRINMGRFFASTVFFEQWKHRDEEVRTDVPLLGPPVGHIDRIETSTTHQVSVAGWSLLGKGTIGRATLTGGGGISYWFYSRETSESFSDCSPASTVCSDSSREFNNSAFSAQVQAGVDVALARNFAVMGQYRLIVPVEDVGSGHHAFVGGLRVRF